MSTTTSAFLAYGFLELWFFPLLLFMFLSVVINFLIRNIK